MHRLKTAMMNYIINAPDTQIRNFQKEKFDLNIRIMDDLMKRVFTAKYKTKYLEDLQMRFFTICLKSDYLDRRIQSIKGMAELCKNARFNNLFISSPQLADYIIKEDYIREIFGKKSHTQLIVRSADIVRLLLTEQKLNQSLFNIIWECTKDPDLKPELFKLFNEISNSLNV